MTSRHLAELLRPAERNRGLANLARLELHPFRRKRATERKVVPTKDAMEAGGWQDEHTFRVYQPTDPDTSRTVIAHPVKLTPRGLVPVTQLGGRRTRDNV